LPLSLPTTLSLHTTDRPRHPGSHDDLFTLLYARQHLCGHAIHHPKRHRSGLVLTICEDQDRVGRLVAVPATAYAPTTTTACAATFALRAGFGSSCITCESLRST